MTDLRKIENIPHKRFARIDLFVGSKGDAMLDSRGYGRRGFQKRLKTTALFEHIVRECTRVLNVRNVRVCVRALVYSVGAL